MIEGQEGVTWQDWVRLARLVEDHGLEGLFRSDHYTAIIRPQAGALDAWTTLAGLAAITERIRLGTLVSPATFRHPSVLARMAVTVDHISGGRVDVGMGAGWYEREHIEHGFPFLDPRQRFRLFAEQVEIVVRSWTEDAFDHSGPAYQLREQTALPRPVQKPHPPLVLGGTVKPPLRRACRSLRRRGQHARRPERRAQGAEGAPRSRVRRCGTRPCHAQLLGDDRVLRRLGSSRASRPIGTFLSIRGGEADAEQMLEERRPTWLAGTVEEVAARISELEALGVDRVMLQHLNHSDDDMVALIGEQLIPALA